MRDLKRLGVRGDDKDKRLLASDEAARLCENKGGGVALKYHSSCG